MDSRLIVNGVQRLLHRGGLSLARAALVGQQIQPYEGIRAVFGEGDQVSEDTDAFFKLSCGFQAKRNDGIDNKVQTSNFLKLLRPFLRWPGTIKLGAM